MCAGTRRPLTKTAILQIPDDPYTMAIINRQWDEMVKAGNKPVLKVVPEE